MTVPNIIPSTQPVLPPRNPLDPVNGTGTPTPSVAINNTPAPATNTGSGGTPRLVPYTSSTTPPSPLAPSTAGITPVDNAAVVGNRQGGSFAVVNS